MSDIRFYHLTRQSLDQTLPELLEKTLERGWKAVVLVDSPERAEALTHYLWTYRPEQFIPHGNAKDGNAELQPIWITSSDERPNNASVLFLTYETTSDHLDDYERICEIFDGNDEAALAAARKRWSTYKASNHSLSYWQQGDKGWKDATPS